MFIAPWVAAAIPSVVGALGGERANRVNQAEAAKNRAFQAEQTKAQMQFQERMRNTSYQAAVADLEAAGLNPALAMSRGGAATPGGAAGGGSMAAPAINPVSSALEARRAQNELQLVRENVRSAKAKADLDVATSELLTEAQGRPARDGSLALEYEPRALLKRQIMAAIDNQEAQAGSARAAALFSGVKTQIGQPVAELADKMGIMLPILGGLARVAGGAGNLLLRARGLRRPRGDYKQILKRQGKHP